ncbi:MAG: TlpA family protein disulfide reductase [Gammaproteobacteria bacterium]|nr:TlpA family protein disulfide reductase [Gammaproteobacteria bacterium]
MNKLIRSLMVTAALVLTPPSAFAFPAAGAAAPDFALKSNSGHNVRLSELRGQVVLINFWATWCAPCRQELPVLQKLYARYQAAGFSLLAVNIDADRTAADAMLTKLGVQLPTLYDADGNKNQEKRVAKLYDVNSMPATLIIDRDGRVRYVHHGFQSSYEQQYEQEVRTLLKE